MAGQRGYRARACAVRSGGIHGRVQRAVMYRGWWYSGVGSRQGCLRLYAGAWGSKGGRGAPGLSLGAAVARLGAFRCRALVEEGRGPQGSGGAAAAPNLLLGRPGSGDVLPSLVAARAQKSPQLPRPCCAALSTWLSSAWPMSTHCWRSFLRGAGRGRRRRAMTRRSALPAVQTVSSQSICTAEIRVVLF